MSSFADLFDVTGVPFIPLHLSVGLSYGIRDQVRFLKCNNRLPTLQEFVDELVVFRERQLPLEINAFSEYFSLRLIIAPTRAFLADLFIVFAAQRHHTNINQLLILNNAALLQNPSLAGIPLNLLNIAKAFFVEVERVDRGRGRIVSAQWIDQHADVIDALAKIHQQNFFDKLQH